MVLAVACGTDAVGVAECRALEHERCEAAVSCGYPDVAECERFERDQCLHGVPLATISVTDLDACARDIQRAGRCAAVQGPGTAASACAEPVATQPPSTACELILSPERAASCAFLNPTPEPVVPPAPNAPAAPDAGR